MTTESVDLIWHKSTQRLVYKTNIDGLNEQIFGVDIGPMYCVHCSQFIERQYRIEFECVREREIERKKNNHIFVALIKWRGQKILCTRFDLTNYYCRLSFGNVSLLTTDVHPWIRNLICTLCTMYIVYDVHSIPFNILISVWKQKQIDRRKFFLLISSVHCTLYIQPFEHSIILLFLSHS